MEHLSYYFAKGIREILHRPAMKKCSIDKTSKVCSGSQLYKVDMNRYSYIGHDCFVNNAKIGAFCSIADGCKIGGAAHQIEYVSTSPVFVSGKNIMGKNFAAHGDTESKQTVIDSDVWIGMDCHIKEGTHIHVGSVVGMGSVLTKDIPPYEIWGGVPAKLIRKRFPDEVINELLSTKWWEWDDEKIKAYSEKFNDAEDFLSAFEGK